MKRVLSLFIIINVLFIHFAFASNTILAVVNGIPISSLSIKSELLNAKSNKEKTNILLTRIDYTLQLEKINEFNLKTNTKDLENKLTEIAKNYNIKLIELKTFDGFQNIEREVSEKLSILNLQRFITKDLKVSEEIFLEVCSNNNSLKDQKQIKIAQIIVSEIDSQTNDIDQKNLLIKTFLNKLANHIKKGASFEAFAKLHSQHPSYQNGGITNWLSVKGPTLEMLDLLNNKEVSEVYITNFGFAIATKVDERFISSKLEECKEREIYQHAETYYSDWLTNLREASNIEIYYDKLL